MTIQEEMVDDFFRIKDEAINFLSSLYTKEVKDRFVIKNLFHVSLDMEFTCSLKLPFLEEEVKEAVFCMKPDKSPSPDEFSMFFN